MNDPIPSHETISAWSSGERIAFVNRNRARQVAGEELSAEMLDAVIWALRCERTQGNKAATKKAAKKEVQEMSLDDI